MDKYKYTHAYTSANSYEPKNSTFFLFSLLGGDDFRLRFLACGVREVARGGAREGVRGDGARPKLAKIFWFRWILARRAFSYAERSSIVVLDINVLYGIYLYLYLYTLLFVLIK